jgi:hypothetical protein
LRRGFRGNKASLKYMNNPDDTLSLQLVGSFGREGLAQGEEFFKKNEERKMLVSNSFGPGNQEKKQPNQRYRLLTKIGDDLSVA